MTMVDSDDNTRALNVNSYNVRFCAAIRPFMFEQTWLIDCAGQFIQGLHPDLRKKVEAA